METLKEIKKEKEKLSNVVKSDSRDYSNDPFFIKKRERAKEVIDKHGIPEHFLKNAK